MRKQVRYSEVPMFHFSKLLWSDALILKRVSRSALGSMGSLSQQLLSLEWLSLFVFDCADSSDYKEMDIFGHLESESSQGFYSSFVSYQITCHIIFRYYLLCQIMPCTTELRTWFKHIGDFKLAGILVFTLGVLLAVHGGDPLPVKYLFQLKVEEHCDLIYYLP